MYDYVLWLCAVRLSLKINTRYNLKTQPFTQGRLVPPGTLPSPAPIVRPQTHTVIGEHTTCVSHSLVDIRGWAITISKRFCRELIKLRPMNNNYYLRTEAQRERYVRILRVRTFTIHYKLYRAVPYDRDVLGKLRILYHSDEGPGALCFNIR